MSVQTLEIKKKNRMSSYNNISLELTANNQHSSSMSYFSINNRRYLGNKYKLNEFIQTTISDICGDFETFADLFAGTGVVSSMFQDKHLIVNDILYLSLIHI